MDSFDSPPGITERLSAVLNLHFDPTEGAPYWLELAARLPFDPRRDVRTIDDLRQFGCMGQEALRARPLTDFIPRRIATQTDQIIVAQTGGTLCSPSWTAYTTDDYDAAFVRPFVDAARHVGFPEGGTWLYVGPAGPHIIGRAARSIARATGAVDPFTVDFDARWAKKLPPASFALDRYVHHVMAQAMAVIETQPITHLFTTPPLLTALGQQMSSAERARIRGVHYGGMALNADQLVQFQQTIFPEAIHLAGFGNTLFGCCLELDATPGRALQYFPHGDRLILGVLPESSDVADQIQYNPGASGRCAFTRLDPSMLLINVVERDVATLISPPPDAPAAFFRSGIGNPLPMHSEKIRPILGLY